MRVNMNMGMKNNLLNVHHINNQNLSQKQPIIKNSDLRDQKDTVSISPLGKTKSLVESLMKQKQKIIESKNELVSRTLEKGANIDSIKSQLESLEEQLENIDEQISQTMAEQIKQQNEEQKRMEYKNPKTEEEIQTERFNSIVNLSSSLAKAQVVSAVKTKSDGEARILETEIKLDESRGGASVIKKERLADLKKQSTNLTTQINENLVKVSEEIKDSNDNQLVESTKPETTKNNKLNAEIKYSTELNVIDNTVAKADKTNYDVK